LSIFVVFFHHRLVLRLHEFVEDELEEVDFPDDFIQDGQAGFGQESVGACHLGVGKVGHSHELTPLSLIFGIDVSGAGVKDEPE
jgi:hypothetical protein